MNDIARPVRSVPVVKQRFTGRTDGLARPVRSVRSDDDTIDDDTIDTYNDTTTPNLVLRVLFLQLCAYVIIETDVDVAEKRGPWERGWTTPSYWTETCQV